MVEPSNHIGVGSTEEECANFLEGRKKEKSKLRKMGENAKSVGAQSDATAIKSQKRLMTEACKTIKIKKLYTSMVDTLPTSSPCGLISYSRQTLSRPSSRLV